MARRLALITGASAGIGAAFVRAYAKRGCDLVLVARRKERLDEMAKDLRAKHGLEVQALSVDLASPDANDQIMGGLQTIGRIPDVLVNNAGYALTGMFTQSGWKDHASFIQVLAIGPTELIHRLMPAMLAQKYGRIINVASLAGIMPAPPGHTLYAAVKAYMIKMSQSLNMEGKAQGVHATALCPGFTFSEFHDVTGTRDKVSQLPKWLWQQAEPVVEAGIRAVEIGKPVEVPGFANKMLAGFFRTLPDPIGNSIVGSQAQKFRKT